MVLTGGSTRSLDFTGEAIAVTTLDGDTWSKPVVITPFDDSRLVRTGTRPEDLIVFGAQLPIDGQAVELVTVRPGRGLTPVTDFGPGEEQAADLDVGRPDYLHPHQRNR